MSQALRLRLIVLLVPLVLAGCQKSSPAISAAPEPAPIDAPVAASLSKGPAITPLSPAQEKHLTDMAKARRAGDGTAVGEVLQYAEQQRPDKFKVATVDIDYAKDSTPSTVSVCYWIGAKRLESDLDCKSIGWEISDDKSALKPYGAAATQALEAGKEPFVRAIDQRYAQACQGKDAAKGC